MAMNVTSEDKNGPGSANANDVDKCTICHELFKTIAEKTFLPCAHYFHKKCIDQWLAKEDFCPICRCFSKKNTTPGAATVYPNANVVNGATTAYAILAAMREPQQMENSINNLNLTGRQTCIRCHNSTNCFNCIKCYNSDHCQNCTNSHNSDNCQNCTNCHNCDRCKNCTKCRNCDDCYNCTNCQNCTSCTNCTNCRNLVRRHNVTNGCNFFS